MADDGVNAPLIGSRLFQTPASPRRAFNRIPAYSASVDDLATTIVPELIRAVLEAADPGRRVRARGELIRSLGPCRILAVGKASRAMAEAALVFAAERLRAGLIISPPMPGSRMRPVQGFAVMEADHPLPTARNLTAAAAAAEMVRSVQRDEALLVLLSGGASALLTLPAGGLTLDNIRSATDSLLRAGATIQELNCVRRHCEQLKGGGLAKLAAAAGCKRVLSLILSDVVGDRLDVIGSGPTAPDPTTFDEALAVLARYRLEDRASAVMRHLCEGAGGAFPETLKPGEAAAELVENIIIGANRHAVDCAAARLGELCSGVEKRCDVTGEARAVGSELAAAVRSIPQSQGADARRCALVWGGETTVTVRGSGRGGRNQELALAAAIALDGVPNCMVMSFATDGVDGNSDAAGAIVTGETLALARAAGLDARASLENNDSHSFFARLDEATKEKGRRTLIRTGPTGTNVNDVTVGLAWADPATPAAA